MDFTHLSKRIVLPAGFTAPTVLEFEDLVATRLGREHLHEDVAGINASLELITRTRGGGWPTEPVTAEGDFIDLVWHECEFREGYSFSYAVHTDQREYLGCCYLYPLGRRTPLSESIRGCDVDVSWWVTPAGFARGYYEKLYRALSSWCTREYPFTTLHFSNLVIPD